MYQLQLALLVWFIIFCVLPIRVPPSVSAFLDSSLGMTSVFLVGVLMLVYAHPVLTVAYVVYAYVLLQRSERPTTQIIEYTPTETKRVHVMQSMNPPKERTLEEEMVQQMAPVGSTSVYVDTSFKPVADDVHNAHVVHP